MSTTRGLHSIAADWLAVRRPTRLAVDGVILLLVSILLGQLYEALLYDEARREAVSSFYSHVFRPSTPVSMVCTALYYIGWTVIAMACVRVFGEHSRGTVKEE